HRTTSWLELADALARGLAPSQRDSTAARSERTEVNDRPARPLPAARLGLVAAPPLPYRTGMVETARLFLFAFGALSIAGGVLGYVKAKSKASLIAGGASGVVLAIAAYLIGAGFASIGLILGLIVSVALAGRFVPAFIK